MTNRSNNASIRPNLLSNLLQRTCSGVIDQSGMAGRGIENTVLGSINVRSFGHVPQLLAEVTGNIVPGLK